MRSREQYAPGAAFGAEVRKDGEKWTLVLVRELRHPPATVWTALTDPEHLREWAPFDADRNLGTVGTATLSTVGTPTPLVEAYFNKVSAPKKRLIIIEDAGHFALSTHQAEVIAALKVLIQ